MLFTEDTCGSEVNLLVPSAVSGEGSGSGCADPRCGASPEPELVPEDLWGASAAAAAMRSSTKQPAS